MSKKSRKISKKDKKSKQKGGEGYSVDSGNPIAPGVA